MARNIPEVSATDALRDLPALSVRRPYLAVVLNLLIMIAGFGAVLGVEVRELPNIDRPVVSVRGEYPGASPETLDAEVTSLVEAAVARVNGVTEVRSSSEENNFRIRVVFSPDSDLSEAASEVREAVSRVERRLPDRVENLTVIKADADAAVSIWLGAWSDRLPIDALTRVVEEQVLPELTAVEGVAEVRLWGERERVLRVKLDPMRLASYRLSVADVAEVLRKARYDVPAGSFKSREQEVLVRANASVIEPEKIEELYVREPVRIGDVASVYFTPAEADNWARLNGRPVLFLGIVRQSGSNAITMAEGVQRAMARLRDQLPHIGLETSSDNSLFIKSSVRELLVTLAYTIAIVVIVIALFTGQPRASSIPTVAIPVALVGALAAVWLLGFSINLVTLLAMVLATGVVVDDAIVVLENIQRLRAQGIKTRAAAVLGTRQVFFAVLATTATLISVFVPISFLPSQAGRLFQEFGFVLAVTVAISSFVALTLVPMLVSRLPQHGSSKRSAAARARAALGRLMMAAYAWPLDILLRRPAVMVLLCLGIAGSAALTYRTLGEELVPVEDRGQVTVWLVGPDGVGLAYTDRQVEAVERILTPYAEQGAIKQVFTITGINDLNRAWIGAPLVDWSQRTLSEGEIADEVRPQLAQIPGARARVWRKNSLNLGGSSGSDNVDFALIGSNYGRIFAESQSFVARIEEELPWIENLRIEFRATQPELSIEIDRERATDLDVDIADLATTIQVLIDEFEIAELTIDDQAVPIMLQAIDGAVRQPSDIANLYVSAGDGTQEDRLVPLTQLVTFSESSVAAELDRHAQRRAIEIDGDLTAGKTLRDAVDALRALAREELSPEVGLIFRGQAKALEETYHELAITFAIAFLVVFLVLVAQFESVTSALVVMITVPFGICAAIFALALSDTTINIYSQIGALMLVGIMAKNAILMVEFADQLRERGYRPIEAAKEASLVRLRPIMMTMVSTAFAGLPLILSSGAGAESRNAIGWVIFGGLGMASLITLFLTPVLYSRIAGFAKPRSSRAAELEAELEEAYTRDASARDTRERPAE